MSANLHFDRDHIIALLAGYSMSLFSLSRSYSVPTYMVLGIVNTYITYPSHAPVPIELTAKRLMQLLPLSIAFLVGTYIFIKVTIR